MNAMNPLFNPDGASVEGVFHRVRLVPMDGETEHISEICDDAYWGKFNDFTWQDLALSPPATIGVSETEEDDGEIWFTFHTTACEPMEAIRFVSRVAHRYPSLSVIHDYEDISHELLGRLWYQGGTLYKECHLTALDTLPTYRFLRGV